MRAKYIIPALIVVGVLGLGIASVSNKDKIIDTLNADVSVKNQTQYNLNLQNEITPIVEMACDIQQMNKVNSEINRLVLQNKIKDCVSAIDNAKTNIYNQEVTNNQKDAKDNIIVSLNSLKYNLEKLDALSRTDGYKTNKDSLYSEISDATTAIDDYIGLGEEIRKN